MKKQAILSLIFLLASSLLALSSAQENKQHDIKPVLFLQNRRW
ncbi:hypothetical protein [Streptococcus danieliae]|nr:hypothetical protein [Streptococcus danieliae]